MLQNLRQEAETAPATRDDVEQTLDHQLLRKAFKQLPEEHRAAIGLFVFGGVYAAYRFFTVSEILDAIGWGLPAAVLLLAAVNTRITLIRSMQTNRVLHEVKHLKAQIVLLAADR